MADVTESTGGDAGVGKAGAVEARFTQDDINRVAAKERRAASDLAKEHEALKAKLAGFEEAQKTEGQKAIEAAAKRERAAADAEWSEKLTAQSIDAELRLQLQAQNYDPDLAVLVKSKSLIKSIDDVPVAIKTTLDGKPWAKQADQVQSRPVSQSGTPSGARAVSGWNAQRLAELTATNRVKSITEEDWAEIRAMQRDGTWR